VKRRVLRLLDPLLQTNAADRTVAVLVKLWASAAARRTPADGLRRLFRLDDHLRQRIDGLAIELDRGVHAKHRLMAYHEFFVERVRPGESVLDIGCGKGELAYDLAVRAQAQVTGVDFSPTVLAFARERFGAPGLDFVEADALTWRPPRPFDVVVLSNVLEHVADRVGLLGRLCELAAPQRVLIRVPSIERDWIVPLRRELGLSYFSDPTHETEYTVEQLQEEVAGAGLELQELVQRWGELWAVARPTGGGAGSRRYPDPT
jgi:2-polyprenyl-3-methyl-5-hydroxy-6-metoxy-1,4-benzoquinol methylase